MQRKNRKRISFIGRMNICTLVAILAVVGAKVGYNEIQEREADKTKLEIATFDFTYTPVPTSFTTETSTPVPTPFEMETSTPEPEILELEGELVHEETNLPNIIAQGVNFNDFYVYNQKTAGIISVPGTPIFLPFCVSEDDSEWMYRSFSGEDSPQGTIFMDHRNGSDLSGKVITLFGHNMKSGKMFAYLNKYFKSNYYVEHDYAYISTRDYIHIYKFSCASRVKEEEVRILREPYFETDEEYNQYLNFLESGVKAEDENVKLNDAEQILQLHTCCGDPRFRSMVYFKYQYSIPNVLSCSETTEESQENIDAIVNKKGEFSSFVKSIVRYDISLDMNYICIENNNGEKYIWTLKTLLDEEREKFLETYGGNNGEYIFISEEGYFNLNGTYINIYMQNDILLICEESSLKSVKSGLLEFTFQKPNELKLTN